MSVILIHVMITSLYVNPRKISRVSIDYFVLLGDVGAVHTCGPDRWLDPDCTCDVLALGRWFKARKIVWKLGSYKQSSQS